MKILKMSYAGIVIALVMMAMLGYQGNQVSQMENQIESLNTYIETQNAQLDLLKTQLELLSEEYQADQKIEVPWFWDAYGYPSTPEKLIATLDGQGALIPFEGVLGGSPFFILSEARILDQEYVFVPIEDGHMLGGMVLKYKFLEDKQVEWIVIDGWWPRTE